MSITTHALDLLWTTLHYTSLCAAARGCVNIVWTYMQIFLLKIDVIIYQTFPPL